MTTPFLGCSQDVFNQGLADSEFCTRENWQTAVLFLAREMELLGLPSPCTKTGDDPDAQASLDVITLVNSSWKLIQWYRSSQQTVTDQEAAARSVAGERERLAASTARQREAIEARERAVAESCQRERQSADLLEAEQHKLRAAREETRRLMAVLLQREAKYNHEIKRVEQEVAKLKERLLKVIVDKGDSRLQGIEINGPGISKKGGTRQRWNTEHSGFKRDEVLYKRVLEEMEKRLDLMAEENQKLRDTLEGLLACVQEELISAGGLDPQTVLIPVQGPTNDQERAAHVCGLLKEAMKRMLQPEKMIDLEQKLAVYEKKLVLYEELLQKAESCGDDAKEPGLQELRDLHLNLLNALDIAGDKTKEESSGGRLAKAEREELEAQRQVLEKERLALLTESLSVHRQLPAILQLPRAGVEQPPAWSLGPVTLTPSPAGAPAKGHGLTLGGGQPVGSRPASRPASRPGSQPGSRAPSTTRETPRQVKGRSPGTGLRRAKYSDVGASLGRKARPKSANLSPGRHRRDVVSPTSSRIAAGSRSPSREGYLGPPGNSKSLPRQAAGALQLRATSHHQDAGSRAKKRESMWSKPPTPSLASPTSPSNSDSDNYSASAAMKQQLAAFSCYSSLPKSRRPGESREPTPQEHF